DQVDVNHDGVVTLLDLGKLFGAPNVGFIDAFVQLANLIREIPTPAAGQNIMINLGDFDLGALDVRQVSDLTGVAPHVVKDVGDPTSQLKGTGFAAAAKTFFQDAAKVTTDKPHKTLQIPLFEHPSTAFRLLLGQPVDLFLLDLPSLDYSINADVFFPLVGPLGVEMVGGIQAHAHIAFGYDTSGFQTFFDPSSPRFHDPKVLFQGFFISDRATPDGTGDDVPEATLAAQVESFGAVDAVIVSAGVGGGLAANVEANLHDP